MSVPSQKSLWFPLTPNFSHLQKNVWPPFMVPFSTLCWFMIKVALTCQPSLHSFPNFPTNIFYITSWLCAFHSSHGGHKLCLHQTQVDDFKPYPLWTWISGWMSLHLETWAFLWLAAGPHGSCCVAGLPWAETLAGSSQPVGFMFK